jgi:hypothetical protein
MQIKPCREALMAGFGGSVEAGWLEIVALIDQLRRSATVSLKQNSAASEVKNDVKAVMRQKSGTGRPQRCPQQLIASDK